MTRSAADDEHGAEAEGAAATPASSPTPLQLTMLKQRLVLRLWQNLLHVMGNINEIIVRPRVVALEGRRTGRGLIALRQLVFAARRWPPGSAHPRDRRAGAG